MPLDRKAIHISVQKQAAENTNPHVSDLQCH